MTKQSPTPPGRYYMTFKDAIDKGYREGFVYWHDYREAISFRAGVRPNTATTKDRFNQLVILDDTEWVYIGEPDNEVTPLITLITFDPISNPSHYASAAIQAIDAIESWGLNFRLGNAVKYISRAGKKEGSTTLNDLQKAAWYLAREISLLESESEKAVKNEEARASNNTK